MKSIQFLFLLILLNSTNVYAQETVTKPTPITEPQMYPPTEFAIIPERRIQDIYPDSPSEMALRLKNVKALKFDIPLVKRDFPFMKNWSTEKIFNWFEKMAGLVSSAQAQQEVVNTRIETTGEKVKVFRPPGYGRAIVVEFTEGDYQGAFEVKMSGVAPDRFPTHGPHGNGLGTLGEVIREDQFENAERAAIAQTAKSKIHKDDSKKMSLGGTVAGYGVMYAGYDVKHADGNTSPAGIYVRQAHKRMSYNDDVRAAWLPSEVKTEMLKQISKAGFYTGWESNIQGLVKNNKVYVFDFGHWIAWQGFVPEANVWVDPKVAVDFSLWGWSSDKGPSRNHDQWRTSKLDNVWNWAHDSAKSIHHPDGQKWLTSHYDNMVSPLLKKLNVGVPSNYFPSCSAFFAN